MTDACENITFPQLLFRTVKVILKVSVFVFFFRFTTDGAIVNKMNRFLWLLAALCVDSLTVNANVLDNLTGWKVSIVISLEGRNII